MGKGKNCSDVVNPCDVKPCHTAGSTSCNATSSTEFTCTCKGGWRGQTCKDPPQKIVDLPNTFSSDFSGMTKAQLIQFNLPNILKEQITKTVQNDTKIAPLLIQIKSWTFNYTESANGTSMEVGYVLVMKVSENTSSRKKRGVFKLDWGTFAALITKTVVAVLENPKSPMNKVIAKVVPGYKPKKCKPQADKN